MKNNIFIFNDIKLYQLEKIATNIANSLKHNDIVFLNGEIGTGKTTLVRHIIKTLDFSCIVKSPSYSIVESYTIKNLNIDHFDLYRISNYEDLYFIGFEDYVKNDSCIIIEWPGNVNLSIKPTIVIDIKFNGSSRDMFLQTNNISLIEVMSK